MNHPHLEALQPARTPIAASRLVVVGIPERLEQLEARPLRVGSRRGRDVRLVAHSVPEPFRPRRGISGQYRATC